jgi:hypothetical protein
MRMAGGWLRLKRKTLNFQLYANKNKNKDMGMGTDTAT